MTGGIYKPEINGKGFRPITKDMVKKLSQFQSKGDERKDKEIQKAPFLSHMQRRIFAIK